MAWERPARSNASAASNATVVESFRSTLSACQDFLAKGPPLEGSSPENGPDPVSLGEPSLEIPWGHLHPLRLYFSGSPGASAATVVIGLFGG